MDTDLLIQTLTLIAPLSAAVQQKLASYMTEGHYPKKHLLLKEGEVCKRIYFIKSGFARSYYYTPEAKERTSWFMDRGDLMISIYSFFTQKPSEEYIEILEDSVIQSISWGQLQAIYADHPEFNYIGRIITEKYYIQSEERAILLRTMTANERYDLLISSRPNIIKKASMGQIASYLGINQETLSRIRAKHPVLT